MANNKIRITSGGQTGADRAALDVAIGLGLYHGGWCPRGRKAEDGAIPEQYVMQETASDDYSERTKLNIIDSDGTLVLLPYSPSQAMGGTLLTIEYAEMQRKPCSVLDISQAFSHNTLPTLSWINAHNIRNLNIAGPRESQWPGMYKLAYEYLTRLLHQFAPYYSR